MQKDNNSPDLFNRFQKNFTETKSHDHLKNNATDQKAHLAEIYLITKANNCHIIKQ